MNLNQLKQLITDLNCDKVYVKKLSPNDNSKNQVYFGGSFEVLNVLPIQDITADSSGDWKKERFKAKLNFYWLDEEGNTFVAPGAQLILYPKYPEVRFSGFLTRCQKAPSELMRTRLEARLLFLGININGDIIGYATHPESTLSKEYINLGTQETHGLFDILNINNVADNKLELLKELRRIHELDWITSKRLDKNGNVISCNAPNCGGYTLEAELGITPNGYSEPDFLGWEIKQFGVKTFDKIDGQTITLMTPEPDGGDYKDEGVDFFLRTYGYDDKLGRPDRINFGGVHKVNERHQKTDLKLTLIGYDSNTGKIRNSNGQIALVTKTQEIAASWSYISLLKHWNRKHKQACFIPSVKSTQPLEYKYGNNIILGIGTDFNFFLKEMQNKHIVYDPAIKMENASTNPRIKRRSQFRIKSKYLRNLYSTNEDIDLNNI
ncbi:hypothetical protein BKI52_03450 [marine bacterium AO1-C]|nr:hypothetical protein BKI52_03450 [marine bacterium AO1-C]